MANRSAFELSKGFAPDSIRSRDNYNRDGHGFETGQVVYFNGSTQTWELASWEYESVTGVSEALGVIDSKTPHKYDVVYRGGILLPSALQVTGPEESVQPNTVYFLSDTPGKLTQTPPPIDSLNPKVRKPIIATLNKTTDEAFVNAIVVNYRGYVEDTDSCVAFVENLIPVGTIEVMLTDANADLHGWLLCDGREYPIAEYPDLFAVIGYTYGVSSSPSVFKVPDFWGYAPETGGGRIFIGHNEQVLFDAYSGSNDVRILPDAAGLISEGTGYAEISPGKNQQAAYHANLYIRALPSEKYVNIKTCNGAGGAIKNWIGNGAFNVWQRGINFAPDGSRAGTDHLADLNRYTADRWFRKVGYCPSGMGSQTAPSQYVGTCYRSSFSTIETGVPDELRKQYPNHYMEYQSYISGPGADTALEYCLLENRIPNVKTLAGETVCVSFWARSETPGYVYVTLKQHFGYDIVPVTGTQLQNAIADASNQGGVYAISDRTVNMPAINQVQQVREKDVTGVISSGIGLIPVSPPPGKYPVLVEAATKEQEFSIGGRVFVKNTNNAANTKVEGKSADPEAIVPLGLGTQISEKSIAFDVTFTCVPNPTCETCTAQIEHIAFKNTTVFSDTPVVKCKSNFGSTNNTVSVEPGRTSVLVPVTVAVSDSEYTSVQSHVFQNAEFPVSVSERVIEQALTLLEETPNVCRCFNKITAPQQANNLGCAEAFTYPKNYDATETLGACCIPLVTETKTGAIVTHTRLNNQTTHSCASIGGQFTPNSALFAQESPSCGVSEDRCSDFAKIEITRNWKRYEVVFRIPSVDTRYIGNSGTDYLGLQLWTHLSNGYCRTLSGAEAPPRNRLGSNFGNTECSENSLCESCVSVFPTEFSYQGLLHLTHFQMQAGTEFTGFVQPDRVEELEYCQGFWETNPCIALRGYYSQTGARVFSHQIDMKKHKTCRTPRVIITDYTDAPFGIGGINIPTDTVSAQDFVVTGNVTGSSGVKQVGFAYECDCDVYRPEELPYLTKQLEWKSET